MSDENETISIPGDRDVEATLDERGGNSVVVACPPHPQQRGHRGDDRLVAVSDVLGEGGIDCLRFDYGDWDEGYGECDDAAAAVDWAVERYDRVGIFGYSFGSAVAFVTAGRRSDLEVVSVLAPTPQLADDLSTLEAMDETDAPAQVVYGERDDTVDWEPVVEKARELSFDVVELPGDHFFIGQSEKVGETAGGFLREHLG